MFSYAQETCWCCAYILEQYPLERCGLTKSFRSSAKIHSSYGYLSFFKPSRTISCIMCPFFFTGKDFSAPPLLINQGDLNLMMECVLSIQRETMKNVGSRHGNKTDFKIAFSEWKNKRKWCIGVFDQIDSMTQAKRLTDLVFFSSLFVCIESTGSFHSARPFGNRYRAVYIFTFLSYSKRRHELIMESFFLATSPGRTTSPTIGRDKSMTPLPSNYRGKEAPRSSRALQRIAISIWLQNLTVE